MVQELGTYAIVYKTKLETGPFISSLPEKWILLFRKQGTIYSSFRAS